jgi:multidrug resistance efflux pump
MKIDEIETNSELIREILSKPPNVFLKWGITVIFTAIISMFLATWFIKYPDVISGSAILTTNTPPQKEYAKITGKLNHLLVKDNQHVLLNTPLAVLENTANYKDVFYLKSILDTIKVNNKSFKFPLDNLPMLFLGSLETDFALFENNYTQYRLNKELNPFQYESNNANISQSELSLRLKTLKSQKELYRSELLFKKKDLNRYQTLFEKGVVSAQEYENKQLDYLQANRNYKNINSSISQAREQINTADNSSKGSVINNTREEIKLLKDVIQSFNRLKISIANWELHYIFQSKIDGQVSFMNYWSENQTVNSGDLVFTIIPKEHNGYVVKSKIASFNSGKVKIEQKVNIKLQNYPETEFGMLSGKVKSISSVPDKEGFYFVDIILPNELVTTYNKDLIFKQEMIGSAEIITEDLRLIERFFYQFKEVFKR